MFPLFVLLKDLMCNTSTLGARCDNTGDTF